MLPGRKTGGEFLVVLAGFCCFLMFGFLFFGFVFFVCVCLLCFVSLAFVEFFVDLAHVNQSRLHV